MREEPPEIRGRLGEQTVTWQGETLEVRFLGPTRGYLVERDGKPIAGPYGTLGELRARLPGDLSP